MHDALKIGFLGAGQMAQALAAGISRDRPDCRFWISDPLPAAREQFARVVDAGRVTVCEENRAVAESVELLFLAVKPHYLDEAVGEWLGAIDPPPLTVSIVAGVDLAGLEKRTGSPRLIRVMPNTPCLVQMGASAITAGKGVREGDIDLIENLLSPLGITRVVPESQFDAVTGLSGSGPAYLFLLIEALSDGGVRMGLPRQLATELAAQTVKGAAEMVLQSGDHPAVLKDRVASPGGTTIAGLEALERGNFRASAISAVRAAAERSAELRG